MPSLSSRLVALSPRIAAPSSSNPYAVSVAAPRSALAAPRRAVAVQSLRRLSRRASPRLSAPSPRLAAPSSSNSYIVSVTAPRLAVAVPTPLRRLRRRRALPLRRRPILASSPSPRLAAPSPSSSSRRRHLRHRAIVVSVAQRRSHFLSRAVAVAVAPLVPSPFVAQRCSRLPVSSREPPLSPLSPCRPWDPADLMKRLATIKALTWFGKTQFPSIFLRKLFHLFLSQDFNQPFVLGNGMKLIGGKDPECASQNVVVDAYYQVMRNTLPNLFDAQPDLLFQFVTMLVHLCCKKMVFQFTMHYRILEIS